MNVDRQPYPSDVTYTSSNGSQQFLGKRKRDEEGPNNSKRMTFQGYESEAMELHQNQIKRQERMATNLERVASAFQNNLCVPCFEAVDQQNHKMEEVETPPLNEKKHALPATHSLNEIDAHYQQINQRMHHAINVLGEISHSHCMRCCSNWTQYIS